MVKNHRWPIGQAGVTVAALTVIVIGRRSLVVTGLAVRKPVVIERPRCPDRGTGVTVAALAVIVIGRRIVVVACLAVAGRDVVKLRLLKSHSVVAALALVYKRSLVRVLVAGHTLARCSLVKAFDVTRFTSCRGVGPFQRIGMFLQRALGKGDEVRVNGYARLWRGLGWTGRGFVLWIDDDARRFGWHLAVAPVNHRRAQHKDQAQN